MKNIKNKIIATILLCTVTSIQAHDVLLEAKGAYFLSSDEIFKNIFQKGCGEIGAELTAKIVHNFYSFFSVDFFHKTGETPTLNTITQFRSTSFAAGFKYFFPTTHVDFYLGLGIEPTYLVTKNDSEFVEPVTKQWGCGSIAKAGAIIDLPHALFLDIFVDYSFIDINQLVASNQLIQNTNTILSGGLFGFGFGYRFN